MVAPYINIDTPLYHGQNALHIAAHKGYIDIFKFLLEKAESANPRDNTNQTPYDVGTDEIKKYLASEYKSRKIGWYKWSFGDRKVKNLLSTYYKLLKTSCDVILEEYE